MSVDGLECRDLALDFRNSLGFWYKGLKALIQGF